MYACIVALHMYPYTSRKSVKLQIYREEGPLKCYTLVATTLSNLNQ